MSLSPHYPLSTVPKTVPENNLEAQIAQGVPHPSPLFLTRASHKLHPWTQYSWLPDVFRVKDSVGSSFFHVCATLTHSFYQGHPAFFWSDNNRYTLGSFRLLLVVQRRGNHHDKLRRTSARGRCKFPCRIPRVTRPSFPIEVGLILVFRQVQP